MTLSQLLVDATDVDQWANRREAQDHLPLLLRRLVRATNTTITSISFPGKEAVQLGGWDGLVEVAAATPYLPDGWSGWELGVQKKVKAKADDDYTTRTKDPLGRTPSQTTFVFVTPRRWGGKKAWIRTRNAEGVWREVRAYDADDLEQWLELAPAVHIWLSRLVGKSPSGVVDLETAWRVWSAATKPALTPPLILAGRDDLVAKVVQWLDGAPAVLALQAESRDEALMIVAAVIDQLPDDRRDALFARAIVVENREPWTELTAHDTPLILVPQFADRSLTEAAAVDQGHHVLVPLGVDDAGAATEQAPRVDIHAVREALVSAGVDADAAGRSAILARKSFESFRRSIAISGALKQPPWADPAQGRILAVLLLAGSWNDANSADRSTIEELVGESWATILDTLTRWTLAPDPPFRQIGPVWRPVAREDAWRLLKRLLHRDHLERFVTVTRQVLGEVDPRYELPQEERITASLFGKVPRWSRELQRGLADGLAILGAEPSSGADVAGRPGPTWASAAVRDILADAAGRWQSWATLSEVLPLLAEAAPSEFLDAVDDDLASETPALRALFQDTSDDLFGSSPHVRLLWALEALAWHPYYLSRSALQLAVLGSLDPGGRLSNRPARSLQYILAPRRPSTAAPLERRLAVLTLMRNRTPAVGFQVMKDLVPRGPVQTYLSTAEPHRRDWVPTPRPRPSNADIQATIRAIVDEMLAILTAGVGDWSDFVEILDGLPPDEVTIAIDRLEQLDPNSVDPPMRATLWTALRELLSKHRGLSRSRWALPAGAVDRLGQLYDQWTPADPAESVAYLFENWPTLPDGIANVEARFAETERLQREASVTIYRDHGLTGTLALAARAKSPGVVGQALGLAHHLTSPQEDLLLGNALAGESASARVCALGYVVGRFGQDDWPWAEDMFARNGPTWTAEQRANFLLGLPHAPRTWDLVDVQDPDTVSAYWRDARSHGIKAVDTPRAARMFLKHDHPGAALDAIWLAGHRIAPAIPGDVMLDVLEGFLLAPTLDSAMAPMGDHIREIVLRLEDSPAADSERLARLEWLTLPLFRLERTPPTLTRVLIRQPGMFAELVALAYRANGEAPRELTKEETRNSENAYQLLHTMRQIPGAQSDGSIDGTLLQEWVRTARALLVEANRVDAGDQCIGTLLSGAPHDPAGFWPHAAVCDVLEDAHGARLDQGFRIGVLNGAGVITKRAGDGGSRERGLAAQYHQHAATIADRWPRVASVLRSIAAAYEDQGRHEDLDRDLHDDLFS